MLAAATLSFLPLAELLRAGVAAPAWGAASLRWAVGTLLIALAALGFAALRGRRQGAPAPRRASGPNAAGGAGAASELDAKADGAAGLALVLAATLGYSVVSRVVFDGLPVNVDEIAQARQANIFLGGHLTAAVEPPSEFFASFLMVEREGRTFSQFPPGWSAALALGELLHARWLVGPIAGGAAVLGMLLLARACGESRRVALGAGALLAVSPFFFLNAGSLMSHTPTVALILIGSAALVASMRAGGRAAPSASMRAGNSRPLAALAGFCLALAGTIRPTDALAFALPAGVWLAWSAVQGRSFARLLAFIAGAALPAALLLAHNAATTGDPFTLGYVAQWGPEHGLGFHAAPWGPPHTPARGLASINAFLRSLQDATFESPLPALLLPLAALALAPRLDAADRYLLAGCALLVLVYFAYWFAPDETGGWLGPRYLLPLVPVAALWTARLPRLVAAVTRSPLVRAAVVPCIVLMVAAGLPGAVGRAREYAGRYPARRIRVDDLAAAQGIRGALILVPGSWTDELSARIWGRGIGRADGLRIMERLGFDSCELQQRLVRLERAAVSGADALAALREPHPDPAHALAALEDPVAAAASDPPCAARLEEERLGGWPLYAFALAKGGGNLYARDLHERDEALLDAHPGRAVFVARPHPQRGLAEPVFVPFRVDSARAVWRTRLEP